MSSGGLIVSIDFELNWGYNDAANPLRPEQVDEGLDRLKVLLDRYEIRSTWATVGGLFAPVVGKEDQPPGLWNRAEWIANNLASDPKVEIGSHTFSHLFLKESAREAVEADFEEMQQLQSLGYRFETLVFPRNQYDDDLVRTAHRYGVRTYRGVRPLWYEQSSKFTDEAISLKLVRRAQELLPRERFARVTKQDGVTEITDSRFFRFFSATAAGNLLTRVYRPILRRELTVAIRKGQYYHIWFHPHNLIVKPYRYGELEAFFRHFATLRDRYGARSLHMGDVAAEVAC